jgi:hypothetical protein
MSEGYIRSHFADIRGYANTIEKRLDDECYTMKSVLEDNAEVLRNAQKYQLNYILFEDKYEVNIDF